MQTLRGLVVGCAVLFLVGQAYSDPTKDEAAKLIVGKWETKQTIQGKDATATLDFAKDGKLSMKLSGPVDLSLNGTYKVLDEKTIEVTITFMDKTMTEKTPFKVSKDTLELTGKDNKVQKFTRAK
jgi:uncharacterized protein (TIGR03066 family)